MGGYCGKRKGSDNSGSPLVESQSREDLASDYNLESANLNDDYIERATYDDNIESAVFYEDNALTAFFYGDFLASATLNKDNKESAPFYGNLLESATLNKDNKESAPFYGDLLESATLNKDNKESAPFYGDLLESVTLNKDNKESAPFYGDLLESATLNKDNKENAPFYGDLLESATLNKDNKESAPFYGDLLESATLNKDSKESAPFCGDLLESATLNKDNKESAPFYGDLLESATLNKDSKESAPFCGDLLESATLNKDNKESAPFYGDLLESATLNKDESVTLTEDDIERTTFYVDNTESGAFNEDAKEDGNAGSPIPEHVIKVLDFLSNTKMSKVYEVNGSTFVEDENLSKHDDDRMAQYELYKVVKMSKDADESDEEDMTATLDIHTQTLSQGVIINSNVFLWTLQWHTMTLVDGDTCRCAVCQTNCDRANCEDHIDEIAHLRNMNKYKPLKRFDLSVVRKINDNFHCGVCNEIFDIIDCKTHENSKSHEGNLLTAINKVSDVMYNSNIHNAPNGRNVHSNDRSNNSMAVQNYDRNAYYNDRSTNVSVEKASYDRNVCTPETEYRNNNNEFHYDANVINNSHINVYEEFSDSETEYAYEIEEYNTPHQGVSYASMASKPSIELPKFMKVDLGRKEVRVNFDSWHMIVKTELNKFYCMVCLKQDHIRFKSQHCISCNHVEKLAKCTVVRAFEDFLIRKVDNKLYHCGHCNNLQFQNQMNDHIESVHPKKNTNIMDTTNNLKPAKKSTKVNKDKNFSKNIPEIKNKTECEKINKNIEFKIETKVDPNFDIFGEVTLSPFGSELKISALSFHFIMIKNEDYYCAVCDKACADVKGHVVDRDHMELMAMTPFIRPFKSNLTRAVRGTLHCSLCNKLLMVVEIYSHNIDQPHTTALAKALGMNIIQKSDNLKIDFINLEVSVDQNKAIQGVNNPKLSPHTVDGPNFPKLSSPTLNPQQVKKDAESGNVLKISAHSTSNAAASAASPNKLSASEKANNKTADAVQNTSHSLNTGQNGAQFKNGSNIDFASKLPHARNGQNYQNSGRNMPYPGQNSSSAQNFPPPPIYNSMLPIPSSINSQNLNSRYLGAPISYANFNAPGVPYPPFSYVLEITQPPNLQNVSVNHSNRTRNQNSNKPKNQNIPNEEIQKKAGSKTPAKKNTEPTSSAIKSDKENNKFNSDNIKTGNDTTENIENQSDDEEELKEFDEEELVFLKLKTTYFKITNLSYNTLVYLDNGIRFCFVCSNTVRTTVLRKHVESREHAENVVKNKFLDKYGVQLFRQMYLMYHCAICNELMTRKEIKLHLDWADHVESYDFSHVILNKKNRKKLKSGVKEYVVETQKEAIFHNVNEPKITVVSAYQIMPDVDAKKDLLGTRLAESKATVVKKNKMVIMNNVVMKIDFDHWHGITTSKNVTKCIMCQLEIKQDEVFEHVETDYHGDSLGVIFERAYYPALVRKINENTVNCMICNLELPNKEYMIHEHVNGRKHNKNQENIINESSNSDSYADCYEEYLNL